MTQGKAIHDNHAMSGAMNTWFSRFAKATARWSGHQNRDMLAVQLKLSKLALQ
jgi:hypothetical protein